VLVDVFGEGAAQGRYSKEVPMQEDGAEVCSVPEDVRSCWFLTKTF
jgi:hypothetical protein